MDKPKLNLSKESHEERVAKAAFDEAAILACKTFVANMREPGEYVQGKEVKKLRASEAKKLWQGSEN